MPMSAAVNLCSLGVLGLGFVPALWPAQLQPNVFTVQVGSPPAAPLTLVAHAQSWFYHKGTNAPQSGWQTIADAALDTTWAAGPGGFGYGDNDDNTVLADMFNGYSTVYSRRTFHVDAPVDPALRLRLVMDWDDGFVAWLDGIELARSSNVPGAPGTEPHYAITLDPAQNHEASAGMNGNPPTEYDLGPASERLGVGTHVLAVMGLNQSAASSDFSLIADLHMGQTEPGPVQQGSFVLSKTSSLVLYGWNTLTDATQVTVNGVPAEFNIIEGGWSRTHPLQPGMNRLCIAALDMQGHILASETKDAVYETGTVPVGGLVASDTTWTASSGTVRLTNDVVIGPGATLSIGEGTVILLEADRGILVGTDGALDVSGTADRPIYLLPADGTNAWGSMSATGSGSLIRLRHAETVAGQLRATDGGTLHVEDTLLRDYPAGAMVTGTDGGGIELIRTHVNNDDLILAHNTPLRVEDSLLEHGGRDGLRFSGTGEPVHVRRSTVRYRPSSGGAAGDGGVVVFFEGAQPGLGIVVEDCLIHGFEGAGVLLGQGAHGATVRNALVYDCGIGVAANASTASVFDRSTISRCETGMALGVHPETATAVASNLIVWGNSAGVVVAGSSSLVIVFSDVQGGVAGTGNLDLDPLFVNALESDFRLGPNSPALGTGLGGVDMGERLPVGGIPPEPFELAATADGTNAMQLTWKENADNENTFVLERCTNGTLWEPLGFAGANQRALGDSTAEIGTRYFYRVRAENNSGSSRWSNVAGGMRRVPTLALGGTLVRDAFWSDSLGTIVVASNLVVPRDLSLTLLPGTTVLVTNGASIVAAAGGTIQATGEPGKLVTIGALQPGVLWRELSAQGAGASITLRFADISGGQTTVYSNAFGLLEDSYFHDYRTTVGAPFIPPIILSSFAASMVVRRCHVREYYETLFRDGVILIEQCLFEYASGDALDFDGAQPGTVLGRSTFRHGTRAPTNIDAVDVGPGQLGACRDVVIEDCLIFDFPTDKGVSIGDAPNQAIGTVVRHCLIYGCLSGVQVKDTALAEVYHCTIVGNHWGFTNYNKSLPSALPAGGGHTTNAHSNILWDNGVTVSMWNMGTLTADHSNFGGTNWPGDGNLSADPLFVNAIQGDYRLQAGSPCIGSGRNGADMGARYPVGAPMAASHSTFQSVALANGALVLRFWADSEKSYTIQSRASLSDGAWDDVTDVPAPALPTLTEVRDPMGTGPARFYRIWSHVGTAMASPP